MKTTLVRYYPFLLLAVLFITSGCSNTRFLNKGEILHNKVKIKLDSDIKLKRPADIKYELDRVSRPKLNKKRFGLKVNLWLYNKGNKEPTGIKFTDGLRRWAKEKVGESPVLLDSSYLETSSRLMETWLFNHGYYNSKVDYRTKVKRKRATVVYEVKIKEHFHIQDVHYPKDSSEVSTIVRNNVRFPEIKEGDSFNVDKMQGERDRIARQLNDRGYYDFNKDYITFAIDSFANKQTLDLYTQVKPPDNGAEHEVYYIDNIYINDDYFLLPDDEMIYDTTFYKGFHYITARGRFKKDMMIDQITFSRGELYSYTKRRETLNNFLQLGVFKFVNIKYEKKRSPWGENLLDVVIYLTPGKKMKYTIENEWNNRTSDIIVNDQVLGTALTGSYENRNTFRGAERFTFSLYGGVEFNLNRNEGEPAVSSINGNASANLKIPRFILPVPKRILSDRIKLWLKQTDVKTNLGVSLYFRREIPGENQSTFTLAGADFTFGYDWTRNRVHRHIFNPIQLIYAQVMNTNAIFDDLLEQNVGFAKSLENKFIPGGSYTYIYSNLPLRKYSNRYFTVRSKIEIAGNSVNGVERLLDAIGVLANDVDTFLGFPYAQYVRVEGDYRTYWTYSNQTSIAFRGYLGLGYAYGNSDLVLPYIRQFYSGGSTGVRAFTIRGIGPGSFAPQEDDPDSQYDRTGDFKVEANLEYRFPIWSYFKGALFVDAGNVWSIRTTDLDGGKFEASEFVNEIGVGGGFGLRVDFSYFIIRADLAIPFHKPFLPKGERWTIDDVQLRDSEWRKDNIVLQIGIGYPF